MGRITIGDESPWGTNPPGMNNLGVNQPGHFIRGRIILPPYPAAQNARRCHPAGAQKTQHMPVVVQ